MYKYLIEITYFYKKTLQMAKLSQFIPDWLSNLFSGNEEFIMRSYYRIGQKGPVWMDTTKPYLLYNQIPQLRKVIDRKAAMFANMDLKLIEITSGKEIEDKDFVKLIKNPNPLQSMNGWLKNYKSQEQIYGNQFLYMNKPSAMAKYPISLTNISPAYIKPVLTGNLFDQVSMDGIISGYQYEDADKNKKTFKSEEILYSRVEDLDNPIIGTSPLMSLKFPLTNTKLAYEYRNVIMGELGALGIISSNGKDAMGSIPMTPEEKKELENSNSKDYGIGKGKSRVRITTSAVQFTPTSFPTKDLLLFEEVDQNEIAIVDHFGLNINIFSGKNQTYENVKNAIIQCYQDTIQVEADLFTQALGKFIGVPEHLKLEASYAHLSILKSDKQKDAQTMSSQITALVQAEAAGIISSEVAHALLKTMTGLDLGSVPKKENKSDDSLGKIPLAVQQLALARERANTAGDVDLAKKLGDKMDELLQSI